MSNCLANRSNRTVCADCPCKRRAMKYFLSLDWEERNEMGLAGRERMREQFAKEEVVEQTLEAIFR